MKISALRVAILLTLICVLASSHALAAKLTGVMVFSCDAEGNPAGNFVWDTRGSSSDFYKIWIAGGVPDGDGLTARLVNGPDWAGAPIDLSLQEGRNEFTLFFQHNGPWNAFAIHLFFDDNSVAQISAKASLRSGDAVPSFSPNSARQTYSMTSYPAPNAPAAGTTSANLDQRIELASYHVAETNIYARDRISTHSVGSDGRFDFVGTFTLVAGPPERPPTRPIKLDLHITEVTICWDSELGRNYQLQFRSPPPGNEWTNLGEPVAGNGETKCVVNKIPIGREQRFYRVIDVP